MLKLVDDFLNSITMYRLMLYVLISLVLVATVLSFLGSLPFKPINLLFSAIFLTGVCWSTNKLLAKLFKAATNLESFFITALILALIVTPASQLKDIIFLSVLGVSASASKYILAINKKHLFNPAAFAVVFSAISGLGGVSWWVGNLYMVPFVSVAGLLVVRKVRRFSQVLSFLLLSLILMMGISLMKGSDPILIFRRILLDSPILFFAFIMLTEPQTTPPTKSKQVLYGTLVGAGFSFVTPEIALLIGNIFSYLVSPKEKLKLTLIKRQRIAQDTFDFIFKSPQRLKFLPGQYLEWTLDHKSPDSRGNRRYFTIASSPSEEKIEIGVKFYPDSSSFKKALVSLNPGDVITASQLSGEFTLPKDPNQKLVFIAGGIGVTPFRSMIKYLLDTNEKRDIVLLYSNKVEADIVYQEILKEAARKLSIKTVYVVTDKEGYINDKKIKTEVPDYKERIFYISGPHSMIGTFEKTLKEMGVFGKQIKVDFFPGYA